MKDIKKIIKEEVQNYLNDNFWKWFGNSKVVDASGKPLKVYHGTNADFSEFKGDVFFFSSTPKYASKFATLDALRKKQLVDKPSVVPVYLSMQNPLDFSEFGNERVPAGELFDFIINAGIDLIAGKSADRFAYRYGITYDDQHKIWSWIKIFRGILKEKAEKAGYDGIIMYEDTGEEYQSGIEDKVYIVFNPTQIKSATGNSGEFNPTNPDITKEQVEDYRGYHTAPTSEDSPMYDVTNSFGEDMYTNKALRMFGGYGSYDAYSIALIQRARNKPNMPVKIYRAVPAVLTNQEKINDYEKQKAYILKTGKLPKDVDNWQNSSEYYDYISNEIDKLKSLPQEQETKTKINSGDWVTINPAYAKVHGKGNLENKFKVLTKTVKAKNLFTDGNSIHEWGYVENALSEENHLNEGYREVNDLSKLADIIINYFAEKNWMMIEEIHNRGAFTYQNLDFQTNMMRLTEVVNDNITQITNDNVVNFIKKQNPTIAFSSGIPAGGSYNDTLNLIQISFNDNEFLLYLKNDVGIFDSYWKSTWKYKDDKSWGTNILKEAMNIGFKNTIVHELQHAYDNYISGGKFKSDKASKNYYTTRQQKGIRNPAEILNNPEMMNTYLNLPHEYWARFSGALSTIDINQSFNEFWNEFKKKFEGYDVLEEKGKKRILNSLYKYYQLNNAAKTNAVVTEEIGNIINKMPEILWHLTSVKKYLESIKQNGLNPEFAVQGRGDKGIYLTDDVYTAKNYSGFYDKGEKLALLKINTRGLDYNLFQPDDYELQEFLDDGGWGKKDGRIKFYQKYYEVPAELSLEWVNQVKYTGIIPPENIEVFNTWIN